MLFDIVNPSDPYTMESSSLEVATIASLLLGQGKYSLESLDGGQGVPFFIFGGSDKWCMENFGETLMELSNRVMDTKLSEVADCLDSVLIGDKEDRTDFYARTALFERDDFELERITRHNRRCSSMNDIGKRAYSMAKKLRGSIQEGMTTVQ